MTITRLIILVIILGGLTLLLVQNSSPVLPIFFAGTQTQALPLGLWILLSAAAGAVTSLIITSLFKLSNYFQAQPQPSQERSRYTPPRNQQAPREETTTRSPNPPPQRDKDVRDDPPEDDWDTYSSNDDWDFEDEVEDEDEPTTTPQKTPTQVQDSQKYRNQQESENNYQSGSSYAYSRKKPENSGVGKTESIYDADYRVIIPPYQPPTSPEAEESDDDDWGFFDDEVEDFERDDR